MAKNRIAIDLTAHLTDELNRAMQLHLARAEGVLPAHERVTMAYQASLAAACSAMATVAAYFVQGGIPIDQAIETIVETHIGMVRKTASRLHEVVNVDLKSGAAR